jgi:hypothetical protein
MASFFLEVCLANHYVGNSSSAQHEHTMTSSRFRPTENMHMHVESLAYAFSTRCVGIELHTKKVSVRALQSDPNGLYVGGYRYCHVYGSSCVVFRIRSYIGANLGFLWGHQPKHILKHCIVEFELSLIAYIRLPTGTSMGPIVLDWGPEHRPGSKPPCAKTPNPPI